MAEILHFFKGKSSNYSLTFIALFFLGFLLSFSGWAQTYQPIVEVYNQAGERQDDFAPGETAVLKGTGWIQDDYVDVHLHEDPEYVDDHDYQNTLVDLNGNWEIEYPIVERHLGVTFNVGVNGLQSGATASTVFTDKSNCSIPSIDTQPSNIGICVGSNASFTVVASAATGEGTPSLYYQWQVQTGGIGNFANIGSESTSNATLNLTNVSGSLNGNEYRCVVTNKCGASSDYNYKSTNSAGATLTVNALPTVAAIGGGASTVCVGATTPAFTNATAGGTWSVTPGTGTASISAGGVLTGVSAGTVTVNYTTAADGNGCTNKATKTVTVNPKPTVNITSQTNISCNGGNDGAITVTTTAVNPQFSKDNGVSYTSGTSPYTFLSLTAATYQIKVKSSTCESDATSVTISEPTVISVSNVAQSTIACNGGNATVTITASGGTGALAYTFDGVTNDTGIFTHVAGTSLAYSVTDANLCTAATGTFTIVQPAVISVSNVTQSTIACNGGNATVTITAAGGTGTLSYTFDGVTNTTGIFTHAAGTSLAYSVTDVNLCAAATGTFDVDEPEVISVSDVSQSVIACNGGTATVTITASGGTGALSYTFNGVGPQASNVFTGVSAGTLLAYSVTDANSCTAATGTFDVVQPSVISVSSVAQSTIACNGGTATVTITASGGTGALSYTFNGVGPQASNVFTGVSAGTLLAYSVTDANSCTAATGTFDVDEPQVISVSDVSQSVIACNGGTATVTITASGGTGTLSYTFDGVTNTTGIFTHAAGTSLAYSVTDVNLCAAATGTFDVDEPEVISVSDVSQSVIACNGGTATVTITAAGGTGTLSYTFDGVTNDTGIFTHAAGTSLAYSVTDENSCTAATGTFDVVEPDVISVSKVEQSTIACNGETATVTITAAGGTGTLSYTFDGVTNTTGIFTHAAGTSLAYSVTDVNLCAAATGTFDVDEPEVISVSDVSQSVIACNGGTATVTITASGGTGALSYTFNGVGPQASNVFTGVSAGTLLAYSVTDANSCTAATGTFDVVQPSVISVSSVAQSTIACNGGTATVTITAAGGTGALSYTFNGAGPQASNIFTGVLAGTGYAYSVTDENSCTAATGTFDVVEPVAYIITANSDPQNINSDIILSAVVSPIEENRLVAFYLDGTQQIDVYTNEFGVAELNIGIQAANVYVVKAVLGNECDNSEIYLPVYDPNGGFVTGGGWIDSPEGALIGTAITGKANFGFVAKYKSGKNTMDEVDGNTNFQFKEGDFHFKSSKHTDAELVISGGFKATYTGEGTINGGSEIYKFRVTVIDAENTVNHDTDLFRIKIWNSSGVVYDNNINGYVAENADPSTAISGGSIVIHKPKGNGKGQEGTLVKTSPLIMQEMDPEILESLAASPNPVVSFSTVRFSLKEDANAVLRVYDYSGRMIETLYNGQAKAYQNYDVDFQRKNLMSGIYIVKLTTDKGQSYDKRIIVE